MQGQTVILSVIGSAFAPTAAFHFERVGESNLVPISTGWISPSRLMGTLHLDNTVPGFWTLIVTNTPSSFVSLSNAFLVASDQLYLPMIMKNASP